MKKIYLFAISVMLLATSCGHKKEGDAMLIRPVKTATASSQSVIRKDFSGIVEAVEYVKLAFRVSGKLSARELWGRHCTIGEYTEAPHQIHRTG